MSTLEIIGVPQPGLGNHSYLVGLGDGDAVVIDPARDPRAYLEAADARGWRLRWSVETHLHADFVSGSRELARFGARIAVPAAAEVRFSATALADGDELDLAGLTLEAVATPGHTPEHLAYVLHDGRQPVAVFSGGALIVGGVARPDLLGADQTEALARAAWRSITQRLLALPDDTPLYPTHGPGSFCSAGPGSAHTSTIGEQRAANPLLAAGDEDAFVERLLGGLGSFPGYFLRLRPVNAAGPAVYGPEPPPPPRLSAEQAQQRAAAGAELVDLRPIEDFAAGHVPGSLSIPLRDQFGVWLGWLVDLDRELVLVTGGDDAELDQAVRACLSVGHERLAGHLPFAAWEDAARPVGSLPLLTPEEAAVARGQVLDVRQEPEWASGHLAEAVHLELGAIADHTDVLDNQPVVTHCGHGERAMTAASLLARAGHGDVAVVAGGPGDLAAARGEGLEAAQ